MSNGLNDFAANTEMREGLRKPFPAKHITQVDKGFGKIDTVNHAVVTDRLNTEAPGWTTSEPQIITVDGKDGMPHVVAVVCSMTIGSVTRWEVGEVERPSTYGDELKKAMSDFIKRAAMRFGVGISLWTKEDIDSIEVSSGTAATGSSKTTAAGSPRSGSVPPAASGQPEAGPGGEIQGATRPAPSVDASKPQSGDESKGARVSASTDVVPEVAAPGQGEPSSLGDATQRGRRDDTGEGSPNYLSKDDQGLLKSQYGGPKNALDAYRKRFGSRITRLADITYEMRDQMEAVA